MDQEASMSQHVRRTLAALGLMAALLFAAPAPCRAAGLWEAPALVPGIAVRVRTWLEGWLLPGSRRTAPVRRIKQGSALDPNGSTTTSPASGSTADQGSALDPNGAK
jgi:hypothetical protein